MPIHGIRTELRTTPAAAPCWLATVTEVKAPMGQASDILTTQF